MVVVNHFLGWRKCFFFLSFQCICNQFGKNNGSSSIKGETFWTNYATVTKVVMEFQMSLMCRASSEVQRNFEEAYSKWKCSYQCCSWRSQLMCFQVLQLTVEAAGAGWWFSVALLRKRVVEIWSTKLKPSGDFSPPGLLEMRRGCVELRDKHHMTLIRFCSQR